MENSRVYHLRDGLNNTLASAEVTFDLQLNLHKMEIVDERTKKTVEYTYDNPNDLDRYLRMSAFELNLYSFDHYIEEFMPV